MKCNSYSHTIFDWRGASKGIMNEKLRICGLLLPTT